MLVADTGAVYEEIGIDVVKVKIKSVLGGLPKTHVQTKLMVFYSSDTYFPKEG